MNYLGCHTEVLFVGNQGYDRHMYHTPLCELWSNSAIQPGASMIMQIAGLLAYQSKPLPECLGDNKVFNKRDPFCLSEADINDLWLIILWKR